MESGKRAKAIVEETGIRQRSEKDSLADLHCPRCGQERMDKDLYCNALSRRADCYICESCGMDEALRDAQGAPPISFAEWAVCRNSKDFGTVDYVVRPALPDEADMFYAMSEEENGRRGAIGHVRIDFGRNGIEFWHSWWPRGPEDFNTPEFKEELNRVVALLRTDVLKDLPTMRCYCREHGGKINGGWVQNYGFIVETDHYLYYLRCNPVQGDYNAYLNCFDKTAAHDQGTEV